MKKAITLIWLLCCVFTTNAQQKEIYQKAKIYYTQEKPLSLLSSLGIAMDHGIHKKGAFYISEFSKSDVAIAIENGFEVEILIPDAKAHFLNENKKNTPSRSVLNANCEGGTSVVYQTPDNFTLGSMGGFLTYQEYLEQLDLMKALYPNLISTPTNISTFLTQGQPDNSVTPSIGGNGIKWVKISDNPNSDSEGESQILYTAIHHAREPASLMQLVYYMWYLLENYEDDIEIQNIVNNTELYFVPVVNPDGYLFNQVTDPNGGGFWRKNRRNNGDGTFGVDNNRNYNFFIDGNPANGVWSGPGSSPNTDGETYHGVGPFSEIETQAIKWFVENHSFKMAFNNHTSGELLYYPHGYADLPTPDENLYIALSTELVSENGFTNLRDSPFSGDSDDFMYGTVGTHDKIFAFTPEIGTAFWPPINEIIPIAESMLFLNLTAAKMVNNYAVITEDSPQNIGNESINDAEFTIKRLGIEGDGNFTVSLEPVSDNIGATGNTVSFDTLEILESQDGNIQYTVLAGTIAGDLIVFDLVVNNGTFDTTTRITKSFGELESIFTDQGDSVTTNFTNNGWATTSEVFVSPSNSITDSPNSDYEANEDKTIALSDPINLNEAIGANVTFYAQWDIEATWDYVQFEISIDNGNTWIPQCGNFTGSGSNTGTQPEGEPLYDGVQNDWVLEEINLSDYLGETIIARFQLISDGVQQRDGFYFDDLNFNILQPFILAVNEIENSFGIYPNPVTDQLNITTSLTGYDVDIYTIQGQRISAIKDLNGSQQIDYSTFASGLYIMTLSSEGASTSYKVIKE